MINKTLKKYLLKIPSVRSYVDGVNKVRHENTILNAKVSNVDSLISYSRSPFLFDSKADFLTERLMSHPVRIDTPTIELESIGVSEITNRIEVADRLITSYHKAIEDESLSPLKRDGEDLWTKLLRNELPDLMASIDQRNPEKLVEFLKGFGTSFVWFGGITTCIDGYNKDLRTNRVALTYFDKLVSLAESLGIARLESPESGTWGENLKLSTETLVKRIEDKLGISISPPMGIIHTDGIDIGDSLLHYRHINALYSATRVHQINKYSKSVCEYGGGLGITAMYSRRLGVNDYTIFDLPITCLLAGHYLIHAIGEDNVTLYGEADKYDSIKLLPYWECQNEKDDRFAFALNQDSFPEISDNLIMEYLFQIKRTASDGFLSINHECFEPRTVNNFILQSGGFDKIHRSKCWVREGYVEEFYQV
ncbi:putative sugar O-methyltransferase [Pantoea endophytica]